MKKNNVQNKSEINAQINQMILEALTTSSRKRKARNEDALNALGFNVSKMSGYGWKVSHDDGEGYTYVEAEFDLSNMYINGKKLDKRRLRKSLYKIDFVSALIRPEYRKDSAWYRTERQEVVPTKYKQMREDLRRLKWDRQWNSERMDRIQKNIDELMETKKYAENQFTNATLKLNDLRLQIKDMKKNK